MTSFQLVNHQIRHIFGGIEAEKNASLEHLQNQQKKISKTMEKAQLTHKKIYQSMATIKNSLLELAENYLGLAKETKLSGGLIHHLSSEINILLQDVSEESLSLSKKMESKAESYLPNLKKIKEKYTQSAENLEHYRRKVSLLKKSVSRQSLANIKPEDHERYQRNKQKLKNAEKEYDEILSKITKRFRQFNNEGIRDLYHDLITIFSTFGGDVMVMNGKITKYLGENITSRQILLSKQIKINSSKLNQLDSQNKKHSINSKSKQQNADQNQSFFQHLVRQKQISNYLKSVIDKELTKSNTAEKIQELFSKAQHSKQTEDSKGNISTFIQLKNVYNNQQLQNHEKIAAPTIKEEQDLLEIDQTTQISHEIDNQQIINCDISQSPESDKKYSFNHDLEDKIKNNLDKFNKICQENSVTKTHKVSPRQNHEKPLKFPQSRLDFGAPNSKNIQIINSSEFFNVNFFEQKQNQKKIKPNEARSTMQNHPYNSPNIQNHNKSDQKKQAPIINVISPIEKKKSDLLFTNFDQFIGKHHQTQKSQKTIQNKNNSNANDLFQFPSFPHSPANVQTKISSKSDNSNNYDLLDL